MSLCLIQMNERVNEQLISQLVNRQTGTKTHHDGSIISVLTFTGPSRGSTNCPNANLTHFKFQATQTRHSFLFGGHNSYARKLMHTEQENGKAKIKSGSSPEKAHCAKNTSYLICLASLENDELLI